LLVTERQKPKGNNMQNNKWVWAVVVVVVALGVAWWAGLFGGKTPAPQVTAPSTTEQQAPTQPSTTQPSTTEPSTTTQ
jgi:cytoskeletal protein RodZ